MSKRTLIILIVLLLVIAGAVWLFSRTDKTTPTPVLSVASSQTTAKPGDAVTFTLTAENQGDKVINGYIMEVSIADISDKASLQDATGASYNSATNSLVWTPLDIPAHDSISTEFTVKVNPSAAANSMLKVKFNNEITVAINNPTVAGGSTTPPPVVNPAPGYTAPTTGVSEFLPLVLALLVTFGIVVYRKYRLQNV